MTQDLIQVDYAEPSVSEDQCVVRSTLGFHATIDRLKREIETLDMGVIHEINPQMLLERGGYSILGARQILFFHPRYAARLLALDPAAFPEIPLKAVVMEGRDGAITVRCRRVESLFKPYPALQELAAELSEKVGKLFATVS
ncbi:DUF302 domain-containing protein [Methylovirgula sp. 4M-Z18]|uniref:DUF302 domain-containing protein n=1 Tax=Methylovirgula sp. 4M-Z18 TaxID=2293567 RepID=UPI000E2FBA18|nr:DUF302 domain-containing protein [Methylovirgula sp. 4M-Z18]RFB78034.1 DUF302 domain-containing protein [Methylovirgula sp. 4M-Z18]